MKRIIKIGMDVHSTNYTLCALESRFGERDHVLAEVQVAPEYKQIILFINGIKSKCGLENDYDIECGYEAGCLGYSLYNQLTASGINCVILAPSTMLSQQGKRVKTDRRDAVLIAQCLSCGTYHAVYIPDEEDDSIKEFLRMRDDHVSALKKIKQQISALCLRHGELYDGAKWTRAHLRWIRSLKLSPMYQETLDEYMATYDSLSSKIERLDLRIEELSEQERYQENVKKLSCLLGIKTHTAMSLLVETGDFQRFSKGNTYAAYLGLAPGESSSGEHIHRTGVSKAGNSHLRSLLVEASQTICKGKIGYKSKALRARQAGCPAEVIAYADRANERLRRRYYHMIGKGKKHNVAITAVARELACFVWGMVTNNIYPKAA